MTNTKTYTLQEIEQTVNKIIVEQLGADDLEVIPEASMDEDLGCDSLDQVELIMALEEEFEIEISDEEAEKVHVVSDAYALVGRKLGKQLQS